MTQPLQAIFYRDFTNSHIPEILQEIYLQRIYHPFLLGRKDLIIVDIGSNIGLFSAYATNFAKKVYAVEPSKEHQETSKKMFEYNKITNITLCPYAISNKNGTEKFYHTPNKTSYSLENLLQTNDFEEVETVTFKEFMKRNKLDHIDLLKADPEGSEAKIFASEEFREYAPKIKVIVGEWHDWCGVSQIQFQRLLEELGYEFKWLGGQAHVYQAVRV